ncbi:MAG TPA: regulatory protein RecX [Turneriella sp.]|nr:regulatory protein RecX [Turneriella sp.]
MRKRHSPKVRLAVKERAIQFVSRQMRSVHELRQKLLDEEYAVDEIETALERLKEIHLLNDVALAETIARQYRDRGNRFIAQKIKQKGIVLDNPSSAFEALDDEEERAYAAATKKMRSLAGLEKHKIAEKLYAHLALRGFSSSIAQRTARKIVDVME